MKKFVYTCMRVLAAIMFIGGIIMCFVSKYQAWDAGIGYYTRDSSAVAMWNIIFFQSIITAISSVFVYGLSYVVEAACIYIDKQQEDDAEE